MADGPAAKLAAINRKSAKTDTAIAAAEAAWLEAQGAIEAAESGDSADR